MLAFTPELGTRRRMALTWGIRSFLVERVTHTDANYHNLHHLKGTVAADYDNYTVYKMTFHDHQSAGLTFDKTSVEVKVDGKVVNSGYEVVTEGLEDGCTFEVRFANLKLIPSVKKGSTITVEYKSKLNEHAVIGCV